MRGNDRFGIYIIQFLERGESVPHPRARKPKDCKPYANRNSCKVGKVQGGFEIRYHEYAETYGEDMILFSRVVTCENLNDVRLIEDLIKVMFKEHRIGNSEYIRLDNIKLLDIVKDIRDAVNLLELAKKERKQDEDTTRL